MLQFTTFQKRMQNQVLIGDLPVRHPFVSHASFFMTPALCTFTRTHIWA